MQSVDHLNIDSSLFPVMCVRKFGSAFVKKLNESECVYEEECKYEYGHKCCNEQIDP